MNAETYAEKPPLYSWLTMGASNIFPWETASRRVSAFASPGILLLTYFFGSAFGLLLFPLTLPFQKIRIPKLGIFPLDPGHWRLWLMVVPAIAAEAWFCKD